MRSQLISLPGPARNWLPPYWPPSEPGGTPPPSPPPSLPPPPPPPPAAAAAAPASATPPIIHGVGLDVASSCDSHTLWSGSMSQSTASASALPAYAGHESEVHNASAMSTASGRWDGAA
ncbi:MAG TPA: hypothetical protein DEO93_04745 [Stenotrophomonas sp.]|nr:hypothetical protein [Stenotrophomonas sp.]